MQKARGSGIIASIYGKNECTPVYFFKDQNKSEVLQHAGYPFRETIMKNIPKKRKKYVENRFKEFSEEYMKYIAYLNEKYYRNGFCDGVELISGCLRK